MILNLLSNERHIDIYAPIRHNLHIWAIPLFLWALYHASRYAVENHVRGQPVDVRPIRKVAFGLALSVASNLTLLLPAAGLAAVFLSILLLDGYRRDEPRTTEELDRICGEEGRRRQEAGAMAPIPTGWWRISGTGSAGRSRSPISGRGWSTWN